MKRAPEKSSKRHAPREAPQARSRARAKRASDSRAAPDSRGAPDSRAARRDAPARREEVLERAMVLIAERGVAGMSLRVLARELGIREPSLYHYFPSKAALVAHIIELCAQRMVDVGLKLPPPVRPLDVPRFVRDAVLALYRTDEHPRFVRFLFAVAIDNPENRELIAKVFAQRLEPSFDILAALLARTAAERELLVQVSKMVVYSVGFMLLEERALWGRPAASHKTLAYADWVVTAAEALLERGTPEQPAASVT
jgi:AcrR family transcriptional regulator